MSKLIRLICLLIISLFIVTGTVACNTTTENQKKINVGSSSEWEITKEDIIFIEGMEESITLNLFDSGRNFLTYIPDDLLVEKESSGEKDYYLFFANYGGNKNDNVYLQLYFYPDGIAKPLPFEGKHMELVNDTNKIFSWALEEYKGESGIYGMLAEHEGNYFTMLIDSPVEFEEGFIPRINKIIENFYWTDVEQYLIRK